MMVFKFAWAFILTATAVYLNFHAIFEKNPVAAVLAVICLVWSFSTYQAFVILYITIVVCVYIFLYLSQQKNHTLPIIFVSITIFLSAFFINTLITKHFFLYGGYLNSQIMWKQINASECVSRIKAHLISGFTGKNNIFFSPIYGVLSLSALLCGVVTVIKSKKYWSDWIWLLAIGGVQISPFLLTFYLGTEPYVRAQIIYPFVLGFNLQFVYSFAKNKQTKLFIYALCFVSLWTQCQTTMRLVYTDNIRSQEDTSTISAIMEKVEEVASPSIPIVFIGHRNANLNNACIRGEMIGASILNWDIYNHPHYMASSSRIVGMCNVLGWHYQAISNADDLLEARIIAQNIPSFPQEGSIVSTERFVLVKLSDDLWPEELNNDLH